MTTDFFISKLRVKLSKLSDRILLGGIAGQLPLNFVFSIEESSGLKKVAHHISSLRLLDEEKIARWDYTGSLPAWVRKTFSYPKKHRFSVRDAYIGPRSGAVWTSSGNVFGESIGSLNKCLTFGKVLPELCQSPISAPKKLSAKMLIPCPPASYFHWIFEVLPNLILLLKEYPHAVLVTSTQRPAYVDAGLKLFFSDNDFGDRVFTVPRPVRVENAAFITMPSASGFVRPQDVRMIREFVMEKLDIPPSLSPARKIFISRRGTKARKPADEGKLEKEYLANGYELLQLEKLAWTEQVRIFSQASHIAGLHGAGFSNLLFAPLGVHVVEIFPGGYTNDCYARLACGLGHSYRLQMID